MLVHEIPELGRYRSAAQHGDLMSHEALERRKLQSPDIGGTHEEDPLVSGQRLLGKVAEASPLLIVERRKYRVPLAAEDQPRGTSPGKLLERGFLPHRGEDVLEDLGAKSRRLGVGQILVRYPLVGDKLQRCCDRPQSTEPQGGGKCHAKKSPAPSANRFRHRRSYRDLHVSSAGCGRSDAEVHEDCDTNIGRLRYSSASF